MIDVLVRRPEISGSELLNKFENVTEEKKKYESIYKLRRRKTEGTQSSQYKV